MNAVAAVLLAFGSIGFVTAVLTTLSMCRLAAFQDVDGPVQPSSGAAGTQARAQARMTPMPHR